MLEASKAMMRRHFDSRYATRWMVGEGIDIGAGNDPVGLFAHVLPLMTGFRAWDIQDGDAMLMAGVADDSFDFVHSSHCLEHMVDPQVALSNWIRICKPGGHLVIVIPDEDLYEQGVFPSTFNGDHKWTFTIAKTTSWSPRSVSLTDLLGAMADRVSVQKIELLDANFYYNVPRQDQTLQIAGECAIEFVLRKRTEDEIRRGGRLPAG